MRLKRILAVPLCVLFVSCVSQSLAEDYFALGTAFFELKRYDEAEQWFTKAKFGEKTKMASLYNLGRIAFERGRYTEALSYFESVLNKDPENTLALKAAAYTCVRNGNEEKALEYYGRVSRLLPDGAEESYNYALLLAAMNRNAEAEEVLGRYDISANATALLLFARTRKAQRKPEAIDSYSAYLAKQNDAAARFEFAEVLADQGFFARAAEELERAQKDGFADTEKSTALLERIKK